MKLVEDLVDFFDAPDLHDGQEEVARSTARFKVVVAGRRWGKTKLSLLACLDTAMKGGKVWFVAPSFSMMQ